jgi:hypothetical protein
MVETCRDCRFFNNDPAWIEKIFPGLSSLSSAYGSTRAEAGICSERELFLQPVTKCPQFVGRDSTGSHQ